MKHLFWRLLAVTALLLGYAKIPAAAQAGNPGENPIYLPFVAKDPPSVPPAAPSDLTAVWLAGLQVRLTWVDHADNESSFRVEGALEKASFIELTKAPASQTTLELSLPSAGRWVFRVRACNHRGCSAYSNTASLQIDIPSSDHKVVVKNISFYTLVDLRVNGVRYISERPGLETGQSLTLTLPPGSYPVEIVLGQWLNQTEYQTVFRWRDTLAVTRNTTYEVKNPAIQQVLTDFGESLYWEENSDLSPGVSGFCFYSDGSLTHYLDNELQISGSYRGLPQVNSAAIPFTITLGEVELTSQVNPFKITPIFTLEAQTYPQEFLGTYRPRSDFHCPPAP